MLLVNSAVLVTAVWASASTTGLSIYTGTPAQHVHLIGLIGAEQEGGGDDAHGMMCV